MPAFMCEGGYLRLFLFETYQKTEMIRFEINIKH